MVWKGSMGKNLPHEFARSKKAEINKILPNWLDRDTKGREKFKAEVMPEGDELEKLGTVNIMKVRETLRKEMTSIFAANEATQQGFDETTASTLLMVAKQQAGAGSLTTASPDYGQKLFFAFEDSYVKKATMKQEVEWGRAMETLESCEGRELADLTNHVGRYAEALKWVGKKPTEGAKITALKHLLSGAFGEKALEEVVKADDKLNAGKEEVTYEGIVRILVTAKMNDRTTAFTHDVNNSTALLKRTIEQLEILTKSNAKLMAVQQKRAKMDVAANSSMKKSGLRRGPQSGDDPNIWKADSRCAFHYDDGHQGQAYMHTNAECGATFKSKDQGMMNGIAAWKKGGASKSK